MKYTIDQIEAMTPEELKRAVATDVMGLSIYHYDKDYEANCYYMLWDEHMDAVANDVPFTWHNGERKTEEEAWADCPDYTGDMNFVFEIVDKMNDCLHLKQHGSEGEWEASFCGSVRIDKGHGETASLAICRAALLAIKLVNDNSPIEEIDNLSIRTYACLKRAGIDTVGQVKKLSLQQVITIKNIGRKSVEELEDKLNIKFI